MKILYIGNKIKSAQSGADVINRRNQFLLSQIADIKYIALTTKGLEAKLGFGVNKKILSAIDAELCDNSYTHVFISQSLLGKAAKHIRKRYPSICIITFMHNIELDYACSYIKANGSTHLPFYLMVKYWEKRTIINSSAIITLNKRDSQRLSTIYHRKASLELPTSFKDCYSTDVNSFNEYPIDYLFVGVAFFANIEGIQWFITNILPNVRGHLTIIGKGMDSVDFKNLTDRVHIKGFVEDLKPYYAAARVVVSPILSGAGMKTKTAEALMFGKTIIGTKEAFEGYVVNPSCMKECNSVDEFINALNDEWGNDNRFNQAARNIFLNHYSTEALVDPLSRLLHGI